MRKTLILVLWLFGSAVASAVPQKALELFQKALVQEQAVGNLTEAIQLFERAAKEAGGDRELAARAWIHAAACYEKLGSLKAGQVYQDVVRSFPEQREQVRTAQERLSALRRAPQSAAPLDVSSAVGPMFQTYCLNCHTPNRNFGTPLYNLNLLDVTKDTAAWEKIVRRLRTGTMPPPTSPRPAKAAMAAAMAALEQALDRGQAQAMQIAPPERASDVALASRLATFLWGTQPDSTLSSLANSGKLSDPAVLEQQVRRMLADARSEWLATSFFANWLHLNNLDLIANSATIRPEWSEELRQSTLQDFERAKDLFPDFNDELRRSMRRETELFVDSQIRQDRPAMELWTANYTFVDERLARYYGFSGVSGPRFRRVQWNSDARAGLLGQAGVLSITSVAVRTSPTIRGKWLFQIFLGTPVPAPPPNLQPLKPEGAIRKAVEENTSAPACRSCHRIFDPLGFGLENFDARGRWREQDSGEPVDASGVLYDGTEFNGPSQMRAALLQYRDAYLTNVTNQLLGYALGRGPQRSSSNRSTASEFVRTGWVYPHEMPAVRGILRDAAKSDYRWSAIIVGIVKSVPFQMKNIVP